MSADKFTVYIEQGADYALEFSWKDSNDAAVSLTGYTVRMQARRYVDDAATLLDWNSSSPPANVTFGPLDTTGVVRIDVGNAVTSAIDWTEGVYDLVATSAGGVATRLLEGHVIVAKAVTR